VKLYGIAEIASALGERRETVGQWHHRGQLPQPTAELRMGPVWDATVIEPWMKEARARKRSQLKLKEERDR
jgi:hypothetical protein